MSKEKSKDVAVVGAGNGLDIFNSQALANEIADQLAENMEGVKASLPQVKILHSACMFKMPDESKRETFQALVIDTNRANAYWEKSFGDSGGNEPPDCMSHNGNVPAGNSEKRQSERCDICPMNQFGSNVNGGDGKACKNMQRVHLLVRDSVNDINNLGMPTRMILPPSSLKTWNTFLADCGTKNIPYQMVWCEFSLNPVTQPVEHAEIEVKIIEPITNNPDELLSWFRWFRNDYLGKWKEVMREEVVGQQDAM